MNLHEQTSTLVSKGWCVDCQTTHQLGLGRAQTHGQSIMKEFETLGRLDYLSPETDSNPKLTLEYLFPGERGHMFGVLECEDGSGNSIFLRAFSSLHEGIRDIPGWVPSLLDTETYQTKLLPAQEKIKAMGAELKTLPPESQAYQDLFQTRKQFSQEVVKMVQGHYSFSNFRGQKKSLAEAFASDRGIPGGVGDCCAPKLLNYAATQNLTPKGLAEFYWGEPTKSGNKQPGEFYPPCESRCEPILGFLLCGIDRA